MRILLLAVLAAAASVAACERTPRAPARARDLGHREAASACATCHPTQSAEWGASLHHGAFTDGDFQASYRLEPDPFCFRCHAPEARDRGDERGAATGVGCASCHELERGHGSTTTAAKTTDCAGCHEFTFPSRPAAMQSTVAEHAHSAFADESCASCHLSRAADGHHDHRFDVTRNVELLRNAVGLTAARTSSGVGVDLVTRHVGHAMPTGDLFRRLRVVVRAENELGELLGEEDVVLARRFDRKKGMPMEADDTRVFGKRHLDVDASWIARAARIGVELRYERVAQTMDVVDVRGERQRRDSVFASIVLAETALSSPDPMPKQ